MNRLCVYAKPIIWCCMVVTISVVMYAQEFHQPTLVLSSVSEQHPLGTTALYYEDKHRGLTIEQVRQAASRAYFAPVQSEIPHFSFTSSAIWLHWQLINRTGEQCYLQIYNAPLDTLDVYIVGTKGQITHKQYGAGITGARWLKNTYPIIEIPVTSDSVLHLYVRAVSNGVMYFAGHIGGNTGMVEHSLFYTWFNAISFGIMAVMFVYNLFLYVSVRHEAYLIYVLYCASTITFFAYQKGYIFLLIGEALAVALYQFPSTPNILVLIPLSCICLFATSFLSTRQYAPTMHKILLGFVLLCAVDCLAHFVLNIGIPRKALSFVVILASGLVIAAGIIVFRHGYKPARLYLAGWSIWLTSIVLYAMMVENIIHPTRSMEFILQIGAATEILLMSFALADRINHLQSENKRLILEQNALLENKVHERTRALEKTNTFLAEANAEISRHVEVQEDLTREIELSNTELQSTNQIIEQRNRELLLLNKDKNDLLHIVAHDLRNPLMTILGLSEMLKDASYALPAAQQRTLAEQIHLAGSRMALLIKNVLDVNAIETGQISPHLTPINLASVLQILMQEYQNRALAKNIHLHYEGEPDIMVRADETLLSQIIDNLLSNAIKYSPYGSNIWLSACVSYNLGKHLRPETIHNTSTLNGNFAALIVRDEGPGISPAEQQHLFKKFTRLSAVPTGGEPSTGLGLSIVKKFTEVMNGQIYCESLIGYGTSFVVCLPLSS